MRIVAFRHGEAEDARGRPDAERALTEAGRTRTSRAAAGLRDQLGTIHAVLASPLLRARQTAELLAEAGAGARLSVCRALEPERHPMELDRILRGQGSDRTVVVVGHQPHLGSWVAWALTGEPAAFVPLRKAGAAQVDFDRRPEPGTGKLGWLMTADQLAALRAGA